MIFFKLSILEFEIVVSLIPEDLVNALIDKNV